MPVIKQNPHPESAKKAKFPIILLVASTYWITISGTCLLGLLNQLTLILTAFCQSRSLAYYLGPTDGIKSVGFSQMLIESLFAAVILFAGIQSIRGLAKGILGYGFGSLCLGLSLMLYTLFKMTSEEYSVWASNIPQHLYSTAGLSCDKKQEGSNPQKPTPSLWQSSREKHRRPHFDH